MTATKELTGSHATSEWTGFTGRLGAWYLASRYRRLAELLVLGNLRPRLLRALDLRGDELVVDAGCGSGFYSLAIAGRLTSGRVICVDLSDEMMARLARRTARQGLSGRVDIRKGDVTALDLDEGLAGWAVSNGVWHELREPAQAARELFRVLQPGGRVVVTDFRDTRLGRRIAAAHRAGDHGPFSVDELKALLEAAGFARVGAEPVGHWVLAWGRKPSPLQGDGGRDRVGH
ncbi:MAG: methyltransferase domain-containing protein [Acidobacteria bacterium]|nr:methyltransferase domain-containing protein [Acidobacteriota bacterium]